MNEEKLLLAMGNIDDSLIETTNELRSKKKKALPLPRIGLIAACLALFAIGALLIFPHFSDLDGKTEASPPAVGGYGEGENIRPGAAPSETNEDDSHLDGIDLENENASGGDGGIISEDASISVVPILVTVEKLGDGGFVCTVTDSKKSEYFSDGERLYAQYAQNADVPTELSEGDTVFVCYSIVEGEDEKLIVHKVYYNEGETTPAYYGGKQ